MPTTYGSRLYSLADAYRDALEAQNVAAVDRITRGWLEAQKRVSQEMATLVDKLEAARLAGTPVSPAWLYQERRLAQLTDTIREQTRQWVPLAETETKELARQTLLQAQRDARGLSREAARVDLPGVEAGFTDINPANLTQLLGFTAPGGPLRSLLVGIGGEMADAASTALLQGVMLGKGTDWITRQLARTLDIPRHRAETIARTEALRVYRETSRLTYQASNVVGSWTWHAALDRRTCPACVVMHGTTHPVTETLDGHPRCRCAMLPRTKTWGEIDPVLADLPDTRVAPMSGKDWFTSQAPLTQAAILGPGKFQAYQAGKIGLDDLVARTHSPEWGTMRRERSMVEIQQGRNANWTTPPDAPSTPVTPPVTPQPAKVRRAATAADLQPGAIVFKGKGNTPWRVVSVHGESAGLVKAVSTSNRPGNASYHFSELTVDDVPRRPAMPGPDTPERAWSMAELERAIRNTTDPARHARYMAELARRNTPDPALANLPRSRYPQTALLEYHRKLQAMDDPTLAAQLRQKDPAVKALAQREMDRRAADPARIAAAEAEKAANFQGATVWEQNLPRIEGPTTLPAQVVELDSVSPAISRYLEGVDGVTVQANMRITVTDHDAAIAALQRARAVIVQDVAVDAMAALRVRRIDDYLERVLAGKGGPVPEYRATNPLYATSRRYQVNCTSAVSAHELRRRGYDVTAGPRDRGRQRHVYYQDWGGTLQDALQEVTVRQMKATMAKEWPAGARGFVSVTWKGRNAGAHVFSVEKLEDGTLHFFDPQTGKDLGDGSGYFATARPKVNFIRVDDKRLSPKLEDYITRRAT